MHMKFFTIALAMLVGMPSAALAGYGQSGFSRQCFREVYREEYIPGTVNQPGRVRRWTEQREVPCGDDTAMHGTYHQQDFADHYHPSPHEVDDNSCIEGAVLGGILGGGAGYAASRGDGRGWAIPLGVVGGALVGCQVDGG